MHSADPYMRIVMLFDQDATAGSFLREDGDGGFTGAVERMAREIDRLRAVEAGKTFAAPVDTDGTLEAAAREAGWALMALVDSIDWQKRGQVSQITARLAAALNLADLADTHAVPVEATPEMISAALAIDWSSEDETGVIHNVWHAMVSASPKTTSGGDHGR